MAERLKLNIEIQVQQFYKWLMDNSLTATEISLWYALMYVANEAGYPVWLSVSISVLEKLTGMKKDAIYKAREKLESKGRIKVLQGQGSQAAKYRLIPFIENEVYTDLENVSDIKDTAEEKTEEQPLENIPGQEKPINIFKRTQELIPMPPSKDIQHIMNFMDEGMEDELLCKAIDITHQELEDKPPTEKWRYFKGIVRNWYNNGIMTLEQYQIHERARGERIRNGSSKQHNKSVQQEPKSSGMREFRIPE